MYCYIIERYSTGPADNRIFGRESLASSVRLRRRVPTHSHVCTNAINAQNGGGGLCGRHGIKERKNGKKKCCLAKGVDVIKTAATNCSFVPSGGVNFGRVFSVSLTHAHTYIHVSRTMGREVGTRG